MQNYEEITYANECCPIDNCIEDKNTICLYEEVENAYDVDAPNDNSIDNCIENICNTIEQNDKPLAKSISLESETELESESEDDFEEIEKIYKFIIKTTTNKKLNQQTLKKISEIYWNKTQDYNKSIKLFESDVINKKFTKLYKENNIKK